MSFIACAIALLLSQDATVLLDKAIEAQQGIRPSEPIRDLFINCDIVREEQNATVRISVTQFYKFADQRPRDDKILTEILDLNSGESPVKEGYNGERFWVQNGDELTLIDDDPVWQETRRGIMDRLRLIQMFRRIFFLSSLKKEIKPTQRLEDKDGLLRIEAVPIDPKAWGVEKLELSFDPETHHLRFATIHPLKGSGANSSLVDRKTYLEFRDYTPDISGQGLSVPEFVSLHQSADSSGSLATDNGTDAVGTRLELQLFDFKFNQKIPDTRFAPPPGKR